MVMEINKTGVAKFVPVCVVVFRWHGSKKEAPSNQYKPIPACSSHLN